MSLKVNILFIAAMLFVWGNSATGQSRDSTYYSSEYLERSTKFAWLTVGVNALTLLGGTTQIPGQPSSALSDFGPTLMPRLTIGGAHFWGHADFYVSFSLSALSISSTPSGLSELDYFQTIETGARLYPWKMKPGRVAPFFGISFRPLIFRQEVQGDPTTHGAPRFGKMIYPIEAGLTYTSTRWHASVSAYYQGMQSINYFVAPGTPARIELQPVSLQVSLLRHWDTDRSYRTEEAKKQLNLKHNILAQTRRLSTWYLGVGPSTFLQMSSSSFLAANAPQLEGDYSAGLSPDITFGRYFYDIDANIGLSWRRFSDRAAGFEDQFRRRRSSYMLEATKNLFNWLGFVPFVGGTVSVEDLLSELNGTRYSEVQLAVGIIAGWDIRVTHTGTSLLRTNLRWTPGLHQEINGERVALDHLEFNFIQYVHYFGRAKAYDSYRH